MTLAAYNEIRAALEPRERTLACESKHGLTGWLVQPCRLAREVDEPDGWDEEGVRLKVIYSFDPGGFLSDGPVPFSVVMEETHELIQATKDTAEHREAYRRMSLPHKDVLALLSIATPEDATRHPRPTEPEYQVCCECGGAGRLLDEYWDVPGERTRFQYRDVLCGSCNGEGRVPIPVDDWPDEYARERCAGDEPTLEEVFQEASRRTKQWRPWVGAGHRYYSLMLVHASAHDTPDGQWEYWQTPARERCGYDPNTGKPDKRKRRTLADDERERLAAFRARRGALAAATPA